MSFECGLCEVSLRQRDLIETCAEPNCPYRKAVDRDRIVGPNARPLSELSYREMLDAYADDDDHSDASQDR